MYIIAGIVLDADYNAALRVLKIGKGASGLNVRSGLMTDAQVVKLADSGEIVVGVNNKKSEMRAVTREHSEIVVRAINKINPRISKQIPIFVGMNSKEWLSQKNFTAIDLVRVGQTSYEMMTVDNNDRLIKVHIDVNERGYSKYAWNIKCIIEKEKVLEIFGLNTARERSMLIKKGVIKNTSTQQITKPENIINQHKAKFETKNTQQPTGHVDNKSKGNVEDFPRFWMVGFSFEIVRPDEELMNMDYTPYTKKEFKPIIWPEKYIRIVDLKHKDGDRFKIIHMTCEEVQRLSLYEKIGNMLNDEMQYMTIQDDEPLGSFGSYRIFEDVADKLSEASDWGKGELGFTFKEIYEDLLKVKKESVESLRTCISVNKLEDELYELILLNYDGSIRKARVKLTNNCSSFKDASRVLNITNIPREGSDAEVLVLKELKRSLLGNGQKASKLGKIENSCGICLGYTDHDRADNSLISTAYLYNKVYRVKISNCHSEMTQREIKNKTKFKVLECREDNFMKSLDIDVVGDGNIEQVYIGLDFINDDKGRDFEGFIIEKE